MKEQMKPAVTGAETVLAEEVKVASGVATESQEGKTEEVEKPPKVR